MVPIYNIYILYYIHIDLGKPGIASLNETALRIQCNRK